MLHTENDCILKSIRVLTFFRPYWLGGRYFVKLPVKFPVFRALNCDVLRVAWIGNRKGMTVLTPNPAFLSSRWDEGIVSAKVRLVLIRTTSCVSPCYSDLQGAWPFSVSSFFFTSVPFERLSLFLKATLPPTSCQLEVYCSQRISNAQESRPRSATVCLPFAPATALKLTRVFRRDRTRALLHSTPSLSLSRHVLSPRLDPRGASPAPAARVLRGLRGAHLLNPLQLDTESQ